MARLKFINPQPIEVEGNTYVEGMVVDFDDADLAANLVAAGDAEPIDSYHCIISHVPRG